MNPVRLLLSEDANQVEKALLIARGIDTGVDEARETAISSGIDAVGLAVRLGEVEVEVDIVKAVERNDYMYCTLDKNKIRICRTIDTIML